MLYENLKISKSVRVLMIGFISFVILSIMSGCSNYSKPDHFYGDYIVNGYSAFDKEGNKVDSESYDDKETAMMIKSDLFSVDILADQFVVADPVYVASKNKLEVYTEDKRNRIVTIDKKGKDFFIDISSHSGNQLNRTVIVHYTKK